MFNHYEKNRRAIALAPRIAREAAAAGLSTFRYIMLDPSYRNELGMSGFAASYAEIGAAYDECEDKDYSVVIRHPRSQQFIDDLIRLAKIVDDLQGSKAGEELGAASVAQFNVSYQVKNYERHGKHCYVVSEGLATLLALTELRGLKCEDLHLPFPCVYLEIPKSLGFKIYNAMSGWHPVEGMYISEDTKDSARHAGFNASPELDGKRSWRVCVVGAPNEQAIHSLDDALVYFTIPLLEGWTLDAALEDVVGRMRNNAMLDPSLRVNTDESVTQWLATFRWALNVMVYATTPDSEHETIRSNPDAEAIWRRLQKVPAGKKREDLKSRLKNMDQRVRTLLGKSVKLTPSLRSMAEHKANGGTGKSLVVRTLVSGHWQRYAVGEGRKERAWRFRQPFWRGPDTAPVAPSHEHRME